MVSMLFREAEGVQMRSMALKLEKQDLTPGPMVSYPMKHS